MTCNSVPESKTHTLNLDTPVQFVKTVGEKRAAALNTLGIKNAGDLLFHFPRRYLDRSTIVPFSELYKFVGQTITTIGTVHSVSIPRGRKRCIIRLTDQRGTLDLVFFQGVDYWKKAFPVDSVLAVSGELSVYGKRLNMVHPDVDRLEDEDSRDFLHTGRIIPIYSSNAELKKVGLDAHAGFRRLMRTLLELLEPLPEYLPGELRRRHGFPSLDEAVRAIHFPDSHEQAREARRRLAYDEAFFLQLVLESKRRSYHEQPGISFHTRSELARALVNSLPFELTGAQKRVLREIARDMSRPHPMNRLLQGDVGSGKTIVALLSMLVAIDNDYQAAFMVPTEILAEQHFKNLSRMLEPLDTTVRLLIGAQAPGERTALLQDIADGNVDIVVGTHAVIQDTVRFRALGLAVIDEQHRFGVMQRAHLKEKGVAPDVLVMTATPIPRTLSMTVYGDLDVSIIDELPADRRPIKTAIRFSDQRKEIFDFVRSEIQKGRQAYIVYPLVEESEKLDLKAATMAYEELQSSLLSGIRLGLLHGRMKAAEKDRIMKAFASGELDAIVATTVIEVGIDVPNATVMIIEHAERFGLAQLHQLRGRVGRGAEQSYCILVTERKKYYGGTGTTPDISGMHVIRKRLETMCATSDGFKIAEVDLEIRGPGDIMGTMQHGFPQFRLLNLVTDGPLISLAREDARMLLSEDPHLRKKEHGALRRRFMSFSLGRNALVHIA